MFGRGFYGVDIFLFFSALGLCFSYNKNSLSLFYYNRVKRVLPLFFILAIFRLVWHICCGNSVSTWDVVATMTGLSYLKVLGGIWVDWYLCALLILYAMFPIIYRYIKDRCLGGVIFVSIISSLICLLIPLPWEHACLIGRLPIFCYGIFFYFIVVSNEIKINKWVFIILCIYGLLLFAVDIIYPNNRTRFLAPSFLAPLMILAITYVYDIINRNTPKMRDLINFIGRHSLEIYVANCISIYICHKQGLDFQGYSGVMTELIIIASIALVLYYLNKSVTFTIFKQ